MSSRMFDNLFPGARPGTLIRSKSADAERLYGPLVHVGLPLQVNDNGCLAVANVRGVQSCTTNLDWELVDVENLGIEDHARLKSANYEAMDRAERGRYDLAEATTKAHAILRGGPGADGMKPVTEGRKDDADKVRIELFPGDALFAISQVLTFGAKKYSDRNWEQGMSWGRVFGACMRHMWCWWQGKAPTTKSFLFGDLDAETGMSHLWHAGCCIAFLISYEEREAGKDDRPGT